MKNVNHVLRCIMVFAIITFSFMSCNQDDKTKPEPGGEKPAVLAPQQIVKVEQAKSMYNNYTKRRLPLIQRYEDSINRQGRGKMIQQQTPTGQDIPKPFDVARYVYYDYKTIKQYMDYIEQEAQAAGVEISTLRFYFSNYPNERFFPGTKDSLLHPRQNSILLSPTIRKGKRDYLFYIEEGPERQEAMILDDDFGTPEGMGLLNSEDKSSHASIVPNFFNKPNTKPVYAGKSVTMNSGTGVPPPYH